MHTSYANHALDNWSWDHSYLKMAWLKYMKTFCCVVSSHKQQKAAWSQCSPRALGSISAHQSCCLLEGDGLQRGQRMCSKRSIVRQPLLDCTLAVRHAPCPSDATTFPCLLWSQPDRPVQGKGMVSAGSNGLSLTLTFNETVSTHHLLHARRYILGFLQVLIVSFVKQRNR